MKASMNALRTVFLGVVASVMSLGSIAASDLTGQQAPDFVLKSATGENLRLSEYRGDVVMINFWATWCGPCRAEMPELQSIHDQHAAAGALTVIGIDELESAEAVTAFAASPARSWGASVSAGIASVGTFTASCLGKTSIPSPRKS